MGPSVSGTAQEEQNFQMTRPATMSTMSAIAGKRRENQRRADESDTPLSYAIQGGSASSG
jgi:hypothetical protein